MVPDRINLIWEILIVIELLKFLCSNWITVEQTTFITFNTIACVSSGNTFSTAFLFSDSCWTRCLMRVFNILFRFCQQTGKVIVAIWFEIIRILFIAVSNSLSSSFSKDFNSLNIIVLIAVLDHLIIWVKYAFNVSLWRSIYAQISIFRV